MFVDRKAVQLKINEHYVARISAYFVTLRESSVQI